MQPFFTTYEEQFTKTPNVFFDKILTDSSVTVNQFRLVGYLIRKTIGYNKDVKWVNVSRQELIEKAGIPNGRIQEAIDGCLEKDWILVYEEGEDTKKKRYIFLNDPLNQRIVYGLKKGLFSVSDLEVLNLAGIKRLLERNGILTVLSGGNEGSSTETGGGNGSSSTETGEGNISSSTETGEAASTETREADDVGDQAVQGAASPLNTTSKDSFLNTSDDDGSAGSAPIWEADSGYMAFRQVFVNAGADDIQNHQRHYPKYLKAIKEAGDVKLLEFAEAYIKEHGAQAQICLFLGGEWKNVRQRLHRKQQKIGQEKGRLLKLSSGSLPSVFQKQANQEKAVSEEEPSKREQEIRAKIKLMNERFAQISQERGAF